MKKNCAVKTLSFIISFLFAFSTFHSVTARAAVDDTMSSSFVSAAN